MAIHPQTLTYIELCAGTGMLGFAVEIACKSIGLRAVPVCYVEREAVAAATLVARMEKTEVGYAPIWDDVKTFDGAAWRGKVDCLFAGYPCQPFSFAGKRLGESDPRHLWPSIRRIVEESQPCLCFFENVPGHITKGLGTVIGDLRSMGYRVTPGLFESKEIGASMENRRLFILATSGGFERETGRTESNESIRTGPSLRNVGDSNQSLDAGRGQGLEERRRERSDAGEERQAIERGCGVLAKTESIKPDESGSGFYGTGLFNSAETTSLKLGETASARFDKRQDGRANRKDEINKGSRCLQSKRTIRKLGASAIGGYAGGDAAHDDGPTVREIDAPYDAIGYLHYPPGRTDYRTWAAVAGVDASKMPCVKSGVRTMDDGMVSRFDRLRLIGNGVDPLQAAYAFLTLLACSIDVGDD